VPPIAHTDFLATSSYLDIVQPTGELERPPLSLATCEDLDATKLHQSWNDLARTLRLGGRPTPSEVGEFRACVKAYCAQGRAAVSGVRVTEGRWQADKYMTSLGSLASALHRPHQNAEVRQYLSQGGYAYHGGNLLGLIEHMLKNRVAPAHGSTAQVALAEVARPISRVLEQEIALHWERIDSLAAGEGHRPYAAEYRGGEEPLSATPGIDVTQIGPDPNAGI
jgi:hypothetical protein